MNLFYKSIIVIVVQGVLSLVAGVSRENKQTTIHSDLQSSSEVGKENTVSIDGHPILARQYDIRRKIIRPMTMPFTTIKSVAPSRCRKPSFLPTKCGPVTDIGRIVGGSETIPGSYPWMAAVFVQRHDNKRWLFGCGGTLVSHTHVLTAAHCVAIQGVKLYNRPAKDLRVRLGDHDLTSSTELPEGSTKTSLVANVTRHIAFDPETFKNDIAILKLDKDVTFSKYIQPICLPYDGVYESLDNKVTIVTGWGYTKFMGRRSNVLMQTSIRVWSEAECKIPYKNDVKISSEYLCAGDASGKKDACQADSGGPLVYMEDSKFYIVGIVSFGNKCASVGFPGVYTRVTEYLSWLNSNF